MRLKAPKEKQIEFLESFKAFKKFENWKTLSKFLGINYITFMHYVKGRYFLPESILIKAQKSGMNTSDFKFEKLEDNWGNIKSGKLGADRFAKWRKVVGPDWKRFSSKGGKKRTKTLPRKLRLEISRRGGITSRDRKVGIHDPRFGENRFPGPFNLKYRSNIEVKVAKILEANKIHFEYEKPFTKMNKRILIDFYLPKQSIAIEIEGFGYDEYLKRNFERYKLLPEVPIHVFTKHVSRTEKAFESLPNVSVLSMSKF